MTPNDVILKDLGCGRFQLTAPLGYWQKTGFFKESREAPGYPVPMRLSEIEAERFLDLFSLAIRPSGEANANTVRN